MTTVPNAQLAGVFDARVHRDMEAPYAGSLPSAQPKSLTDQLRAGDLVWLPSAALVQQDRAMLFPRQPGPDATLSRRDLFLMISRAVAAGAPAPDCVEFEMQAQGPEMSVRMADNDRTGVSLFADLFTLPLPTLSGWYKPRGRQHMASFGASSAQARRSDRDPAGLVRPRLHRGWVIAVHCYVDVDAPPAGPLVAAAQLAPQPVGVIA